MHLTPYTCKTCGQSEVFVYVFTGDQGAPFHTTAQLPWYRSRDFWVQFLVGLALLAVTSTIAVVATIFAMNKQADDANRATTSPVHEGTGQ